MNVAVKKLEVKENDRGSPLVYLVLVFFGLAIGLLGVELLLRIFKIGYGNSPFLPDQVLHHIHPPSYLFRAYDPAGEYGGHLVRYDQNSLRIGLSDEDQKITDNGAVRVAFMGDSFVEAISVPYERSFVGILSANASSDIKIRNFGVSSYSPTLYLLQWRELVSKFKPTHLFLMLYSNDVSDDREYLARGKFSQSGEVVAIPGPPFNWLTTLARQSYLIRFLRRLQLQILWMTGNLDGDQVGGYLEENPEIPVEQIDSVTKLAELVKAQGGKFILTAVPSKFRLFSPGGEFTGSEFSDKWRDIAKDRSMTFVDLVPIFKEATENGKQLFYSKDIHLNEDGHAVVAKELQRLYTELFRGR